VEIIDTFEGTNLTENEKARMNNLKVKEIIIIFFDIRDIIVMEWIPGGQAVNQIFYLQALNKLGKGVRKESPEL
jgi:hypothetical protein